jgi:3,5-epimerase/4-reductase
MKFLLYGKGWIANMVLEYLKEHKYDVTEGNSRVDKTEDVINELTILNPTHILCFIGRTHGVIDGVEYPTIDYLEQEGKLFENIRDNLFSQINLAVLCQKMHIHLSIIGTGCIFNYDEKHTNTIGFTEKEEANFFGSSYSIVKGFTDRLLHLYPVSNLRIRMPIKKNDLSSRNFITKIINYEKICSMDNSMTVLDDFIPIIINLSEKNFIGTINLTNPGTISHNEILEMYKEIVDPNFTWKNFSYEEQVKLLKNGRSNNYLDTTLLESLYSVPNIKESIKSVLHSLKK